MHDAESLEGFAQEIAALNNISLDLVRSYAVQIGDTPNMVSADSDLVIVRDDRGRELARVHLPIDDGS